MKRVARLIVALAGLVWAVPGAASAAPIVNLLPSSDIVATPGQTVGWGYQITNDDANLWLVFTSMTTDAFQHGSGTDIFDYPILPPATSVTQPYALSAGLFAFTWDVTAPAGWVNSGIVLLTADLYSGDPFIDGVPVSSLEFMTPYSTSISTATAPVPEPATLLLVGAAAIASARRVRRRGMKAKE